MPMNYPSWASWRSREVYLPADFHTKKSFNNSLSILKVALRDSSVFDGGKIDSPLLLLGLLFREVSRTIEVEPGESTAYPQQLVNSPLGIGEMIKIEELVNSVALPLVK